MNDTLYFSGVTIQNLTDREVRIYCYCSEANQMAKQNLITVVTCAPQGKKVQAFL